MREISWRLEKYPYDFELCCTKTSLRSLAGALLVFSKTLNSISLNSDSALFDVAQLDNFIDPSQKYPVIAVTSRLMSTGVDAETCEIVVLDLWPRPKSSIALQPTIFWVSLRSITESSITSVSVMRYPMQGMGR